MMTKAAKTLKERSERENLSEHVQERVDNAIEESETLEHSGTLRLDALSQKEEQDRLIMNQLPKLSYEKFEGSYSGFQTFIKNAHALIEFFPNDPEQQLVQLSKITSPEISKTLLSFSGSKQCSEKALQWLHLRYGNPHLQLPAVYDEIKMMAPAKSQADIPKAAERILSKIEALSSLKEDTQPLPSDVVTAIFRALHFSTEEKKAVLPLLEEPEELSIAEIRKYTSEHFKTYELMVIKHWSSIHTKNSHHKNEVNGGAGLIDGTLPKPKGGNKGREGKEDQMGKKLEMVATKQTLSKGVEEST